MKSIKYKNIKPINYGFALPLVLIVFVIIALISSVSVKISLMDETLGRNQTDRSISKKMAELALMDARDDILCTKKINGTTKNDGRGFYNDSSLNVEEDKCSEGLCGYINDDTAPKYWDDMHLSTTSTDFASYGQFSGRSSIGNGLFGSVRDPRYIIESIQVKLALGDSGNNEWQYRITAVGYGKYNPNVFTKIQEVYRVYEGISKCSYGSNASYTRNFSETSTYNR